MPSSLIRTKNHTLFLLNIALNKNDSALAANVDIVTVLSGEFKSVNVVTRFWDGQALSKNVSVNQISGGTLTSRAKGLCQLMLVGATIIRTKGPKCVLFHMNDKFAAVIGPILWMFRVKFSIWYSHAVASRSLKWANLFVTQVLTTADDAYPLKHKNVLSMGQLVSSRQFALNQRNVARDKQSIISVGRIAKSKHLEDLFIGLSEIKFLRRVILVGSHKMPSERVYLRQISELANERNIELIVEGIIGRKELPKLYHDYSILFSGTRRAIDKSAIEGALCGTFVVSTNSSLLKITGMEEVFRILLGNPAPTIKQQIESLIAIPNIDLEFYFRQLIAEETERNCSLEARIEELSQVITFQS